MNNIKKKIASAAAAATMLMSVAAPAFASVSVHISGNGAFSDSRVSLESRNETSISQRNTAHIGNDIVVDTNTGGNDASFNTGGVVVVRSGEAHSSVDIQNNANQNFASIIQGLRDHDSDHIMDNHMDHHVMDVHAHLSGWEEVPHKGDPDGSGHAGIRMDLDENRLCVVLHVYNIDPATAAHIHEAPPGETGPVVVQLPTPNADGHAEGCLNVDHGKLMQMHDNPMNFYVNVHNNPYPDGAVRGQLH